MKTNISMLIVAVLLGMTACPLMAEEQLPTVHVHYGDLNLNNDIGIARLYERLRSASKEACSSYDNGRYNLTNIQRYSKCKAEAFDTAVAKVNSRALLAYTQARR